MCPYESADQRAGMWNWQHDHQHKHGSEALQHALLVVSSLIKKSCKPILSCCLQMCLMCMFNRFWTKLIFSYGCDIKLDDLKVMQVPDCSQEQT